MEKRSELVDTFIDSIPIFAGAMMYQMLFNILEKVKLQEGIESWFNEMDNLCTNSER